MNRPSRLYSPGLGDLAAFDPHVIDEQLPGLRERVEIETERANIGRELFRGFFERHEYAGLAELGCTAHQKLDREQGLAATRSTTHQGRATAWQATASDVIESVDSCRRFCKLLDRRHDVA
jgi:hypothetical protein